MQKIRMINAVGKMQLGKCSEKRSEENAVKNAVRKEQVGR